MDAAAAGDGKHRSQAERGSISPLEAHAAFKIATASLFSAAAFATARRAATVLVDETLHRLTQTPTVTLQCRLTRFRSFTFNFTNRSHPNAGRIREFLLDPLKEPSGCSRSR
jgi:hypothetical protein